MLVYSGILYHLQHKTGWHNVAYGVYAPTTPCNQQKLLLRQYRLEAVADLQIDLLILVVGIKLAAVEERY